MERQSCCALPSALVVVTPKFLNNCNSSRHVHDHVNVHVDVHVIVDVVGFFVTIGYILPASWAFIRLPANTI
jgi:hypothetical protein